MDFATSFTQILITIKTQTKEISKNTQCRIQNISIFKTGLLEKWWNNKKYL